jgi:hypothetical protein
LNLPLKLFFQDEARFGRINEPQDCWAPEGFRPDVPSQIVREYTYAYGAICPQDGAACYLILPAMDGVCMNVFLQELSARYAEYFLLVVYDGAPCHSPGVLDIPTNMMVVKLPPQSPNLNPKENGWDDMREKFFHNLVFDSMQAVENQLVIACSFYESHPEIIHSIAAWDWIISAV